MNPEKILKIEGYGGERNRWGTESGYRVTTNEQEILLAIDDEQGCCESWGYFWCNDDPQEFVGATLLGLRIVDDALDEARMKDKNPDPGDELFEGSIMFVNLETSEGVLQFVAYNQHNGYYGHDARVSSKQLKHDEVL